MEKNYQVTVNPSVYNSIVLLGEESFDMVLYDGDNAFPLQHFMNEMSNKNVTTPVTVMASKTEMAHTQQLLSLGVASIIKKPFTREKLLQGINKGFKKKSIKKASSYVLKESSTDILIGLNKHATVTQVTAKGMTMLLPTGLSQNTQILFSNTQLLDMIGLSDQNLPKIKLTAVDSVSKSDYQFEVECEFVEPMLPNFKQNLEQYLEQHAVPVIQDPEIQTVVVADADTFTCDFYCDCLEGMGLQVLTALDGNQALEHLTTTSVNLIIMDILLPKLNGLQIIEIMKKKNMAVPVIIATGENDPLIRLKVSPKVEGYLLKPFNRRKFVNYVNTVINSYKQSNKVEKEVILTLSVHLETNILVAFRDRARLKSVIGRELILERNDPIALGTTIFLKTEGIGIVTPEQTSSGVGRPLELLVTQCEKLPEGEAFTIHAAIQ